MLYRHVLVKATTFVILRGGGIPARLPCLQTSKPALDAMEEDVADAGLRGDLLDLVGEETGFDVDEAAALVTDQVLRRLDQY